MTPFPAVMIARLIAIVKLMSDCVFSNQYFTALLNVLLYYELTSETNVSVDELNCLNMFFSFVTFLERPVNVSRVSVFTGLDYWNGIVEWNTGMENHAQNVVIRDMHACALVVHT